MKEWNKKHISFWKDSLMIQPDGYTLFQTNLLNKIKEIFDSNSIDYKISVSNHPDLNNPDITVKMVTVNFNETSKLWIYHDMAEYDISEIHHIYEEWGYLKPSDLNDEYLKSVKTILKV